MSGASTLDIAAASAAVAARLLEICRRADRMDLAARLEPAVDALDGDHVTVVVAGESQRGKSTLVNSLLDAPGLIPAGSDRPTSVPITVLQGTLGRITAHCPGRPPMRVAAGQLEAYLANHGPDSDDASCVEVIVEHDHPLLSSGLRFVDTPGVGGLQAGHAALTLAALSRAEALMFVVDPTVPITRGELDFVVAAAARTAVFFVVARIDGTSGWTEILDHDRRLVAEHAPHLADAPWFPVSAELKAMADRRGGSTAARALADSGIAELGHALRDHVVEGSRARRAANLRQVCSGVIDALAEPEHAMLAALEGAPDDAAVDAERAQLAELLGKSARWRAELDVEIRRLSIDLETETEFVFTQLNRRFEQRIASEKRLSPDRIAADLDSEVASVWVDVDRFLQDRMVMVLDGLVEQLGFDGAAPAVGHLAMPERVRDAIHAWQESVPARVGGAETILQYYPVIFSGGLVATLSTYMTSLFAVTVNPMQIAVGGLATMGATFSARRTAVRRTTNRQEALQLVRTALSQARSTIGKQVSRQVVDGRAAVEAEIAAQLDTRRAMLARRQAEQRDVPKAGPARRKVAERSTQRLADLEQIRQRLDQLGRSHINLEPLPSGDGPMTVTKVVEQAEEAP